ncbi:hypothetical protein NLU13_0135 [Sarocladium strictum]|uniref:Cutinase n=1 Tax=Sarocladium strictum TaxID=5046 RepID=A0AA39LAJ4_SARSR|nr:hypothetical protein NLU13_0135 [Sarocladium strictum]
MLTLQVLTLSLASAVLVAGQTVCPEIPARGTSEPNFEAGDGKFGVIVGDPVVSNTTAALPGARGYPVQYPASAAIITGVRRGARDVVSRLRAQSALCPNQTFSLVGYSQGAAVMHAAAEDIPAALYPKIKSLVMFGDGVLRLGAERARFPAGLDEKTRQVCADGDPTCDPEGECTFFHLTYVRPEYIDPAVDFIVSGFTS